MKQIVDAPVSGKIWAITGNVGNGKNTLSMEFIVYLSKRCFHGIRLTEECPYCTKYGIKDRRLHVAANFDITEKFCLEHNIVFFRMYNVKDLLAIKKGRFHQLWIIDEPNAFCFDSRSSMSEDNKLVARKFQRCRHFNADVLFLTQLSSMVDLRGRRLFQKSIFAITPFDREFAYALFTDTDIIPLLIPKVYAKRKLLNEFSSDYVEPSEMESD